MVRPLAADELERGELYYHVVSRAVWRSMVFHELEKERFVKYMRMYERFCGVRVLTFCIMTNHFHLLVEVPKRPKQGLDEAWLVQHVAATLGQVVAEGLVAELAERRKVSAAWADELVESYFARMWDLSAFVKALKQKFYPSFVGLRRLAVA